MMLRRYFHLYRHILAFSLKSILTYRSEFVAKLFYGPAYTGVLFMMVLLVYYQTDSLAGWSKKEGLLLFSVLHLLYTSSFLIYMRGIQHFLWGGLRRGDLDFLLTKPVNFQFLANFSWPEFEHIPLVIAVAILFSHQVILLHDMITLLNIAAFLAIVLPTLAIIYFTLSSYQTMGFYVVKAAQIIEITDKTADLAQYPPQIFPAIFQVSFFTFIPIAFFGYVPTLFLLGRGSVKLFIAVYALAFTTFFINKLAWKEGLKHYSSASS